MEKRWRDFPDGRRWLYALIVLSLLPVVPNLVRTYDDIVRPLPAWMIGARRWHDELLFSVFGAILATAAIKYDRKRLRQEAAATSDIQPHSASGWRDKPELRLVLYSLAVIQFIEVPFAASDTLAALRDPYSAPDSFWSLFPKESLLYAAIGVALIFYDRKRIRRDLGQDTNHCLFCGYDLRATPDRCPECGTIPNRPS